MLLAQEGWCFIVPVDLSTRVANLRLKNPIVVASGVLGVSLGLMRRAEEAGAAAITLKTVTLEAREGYINPVVYDLGYGVVNSMGLPNPGAREMGLLVKEAKRLIKVPLIASIGASSPEEAEKIAENLTLADALEVNASCPHVKGLGAELMSDPEALAGVTAALKSFGLPVFVKLSAHGDWLKVASRALDAGADGFVAINTLKAMVIDVRAKCPVLGGIYGGLSGSAIHPVAVRVVYELHREFPGVPLVGVGGVETWLQAVELLLAGASAVGIATVLRRGFQVISEIVEGIRDYLAREGFTSVSEIIGLAHRC
ncbi:MAG: dihydroorotate dehydrogenase [Thermofilaceae archaeon]